MIKKSEWKPECMFSVGVNFDIPYGLPLESARGEIERALAVLLPKVTVDAVVKKCKTVGAAGHQIDIYQRPMSDTYGTSWCEDIDLGKEGKCE